VPRVAPMSLLVPRAAPSSPPAHRPIDFVDPAHSHLVCRLNKFLYDLRQVLRIRYHRFVSYLVSIGFVTTKLDTSLFVYRRSTDTMYFLAGALQYLTFTRSDISYVVQWVSSHA
jgi:hypothetical protein